jgi:hypothetical protein
MFADNNAVSIDEAFGEYCNDTYAVLETFYAPVARLVERAVQVASGNEGPVSCLSDVTHIAVDARDVFGWCHHMTSMPAL